MTAMMWSSPGLKLKKLNNASMTNSNEKTQEQIAEENRKASAEAHQLAMEQEERDRLAGKKPIISSVAESIKGKLEREEFKVALDENGNQVPPRPAPKK
jgi:hypothetical protein